MPDITDVLKEPEKKIKVDETPAPDDNTFTANEYVTHVKHMEMISLRASEPIRRIWDRSWGLYNNAYDFSTKAPWQSKNYIPRTNMTVRAATFMVKRALLGPSKPYTVEGVGDFGKLIAYYMDKLTMCYLEEANYVTKLTDSLHAGMLSSLMVLKVYPVYVNEDSIYFADPMPKPVQDMSAPIEVKAYKRLKIRIDPVDPYNIHLDPTGQGKYLIHDITMDLYDLVALAEDPNSGFDLEEVKKIHEDFSKNTSENPNAQPEYRSGQALDMAEKRRARTVLIQEFWGDVWSPDGKLINRNCTYAVANKTYLVKKPKYNKLPDKLPPFVISPVIRKPFSVWHQGFVEVVAGLQVMMTELANLMIDANLFASVKAFEVDIDQVYDPTELIQGITPGKAYKKRGGGFNTTPMIRDLNLGNLNQQSLQIFQALDREFQNGVGLNEFAMPTTRSGGRTTATEVLEKSQSATTFMEEIARTMEEGVMEPLLNKMFHYIAEYMANFTDPYTVSLFGADGASKLAVLMQNKTFRDAIHKAPVMFKARGLSASMAKLRDLEKLGQLAKIIAPYPELQSQVNPEKIMRKAIEALGWYPQDVLNEIDENGPMKPPPAMGGNVPMPNMPIADLGGMGFMGNANAGMRQVPQNLSSVNGGY